jgi:hypothetical protein
MAETSAQFLKQLHRGLKWRVPPEEANDIIRDYQEFFDEEQKSGKTEAQIIAALGSPRQVIRTLMAERTPTLRQSLYRLCLALAIAAAVFMPVIAYQASGYLWYFMQFSGTSFAYVLLAPFPVFLLYFLRPAHGRRVKRGRLYIWASGLSLLLFCVSSALMFLFLREFFVPLIGSGPLPLINFVYYPMLLTSLTACIAWVSGIFSIDRFGRYTPALYFLYAAIQCGTLNYIDLLSNMNFEDDSMRFGELARTAFYSVGELLLFAAVGAALWCGLQTFLAKRGDR